MGLDTALDTLLHNGRGTLDSQTKIYGVVPALVTAVNDPKSNKRHMMGKHMASTLVAKAASFLNRKK